MVIIRKTNKKFMSICTRKTHQNDRMTYCYEDAEGNVYIIEPEKDGVREIDIKLLHSMDDSEIYYNNKNLRPTRTKEEKEKINKWKERYIQNFREEYGYTPNKEDVNYTVEQVFPRNYNLSLDYEDVDFEKSEIGMITAKELENNNFYWSDRITNVMEKMTDKQKEVIKLMFVDGLSQKEISDTLGISAAAVNKHFKKGKDIIKRYF